MPLSAPIHHQTLCLSVAKMSDVLPMPVNGGESDESEDDSESDGSGETQHNVCNHMLAF